MIIGPGVTIYLPPKTGTTALRAAAQAIGWRSPRHHMNRWEHPAPAGHRIVCARRNPWSWYASLYDWISSQGTGCWRGFGVSGFRSWMRMLFQDHPAAIGFPEAQRVVGRMRATGIGLATYRVVQLCGHGDPQKMEPRIPEDVLWLRTEHLAEDWEALLCLVGVRGVPPLPRLKTSTRERDWRDYYDADLRDRVAIKDQMLIERFGYTFDG